MITTLTRTNCKKKHFKKGGKDMNEEKLKAFTNNEFIYRKLAEGGMTRNEIANYEMYDLSKPQSSAYRIIDKLLEDEDNMIVVKDGKISIDEAEFEKFIEELIEPYDFLNERESRLKTQIEELEETVSLLESKLIDALESQQVIYKDTVEIEDPAIEPFDTFMITRCGYSDYELQVIAEQNEWTRESFFKEQEDCDLEENPDGCVELTQDNSIKRGFIKTFTESLFKKRCEDTKTYNEMVEKTGDKEAVDEVVEKRKEAAAIDVSTLKNLSNAQKIALYTYMGRYKNTEMEGLLNLAGNKCINADFLIRALENGETINNYSNMRDFLRQMTKPSEVALKQEFAEELIKGQWYITAECNGEKKKYQLMPVDEYNFIKSIVLGEKDNISAEKNEPIIEKEKEDAIDNVNDSWNFNSHDFGQEDDSDE